MPEQQQKLCPQCQAPVPVHRDFTSWCAECGWNLAPLKQGGRAGFLARRYEALGEKHGRALFRSLRESPEHALRPRLNLTKVIAFALSTCVYLIAPCLLGLAVFLISWNWPNPFSIIVGVVLLMLVWLLRPRLGKVPEDGIDSREFPTLFRTINHICDQLGTGHVVTVVVDDSFNAAVSQVGWRRHSVLWIGLPLWMILTPEERIALISHEISHCANGDPTRSFVVGNALNTLQGWLHFLRPEYVQPLNDPFGGGLGAIISHYLFWTLSLLVELVMWILSILVWRNMQIAEYLADYLAAKISGTAAVINVLHKLSYEQYFERVILTNKFSLYQSGREVLDNLINFLASLPDHEIERIIRVDQMAESRLDDTHPPTAFRIEFLENHPNSEPKLTLTPAEHDALDREMDSAKEAIGKRLIDQVMAFR